MADTKRKSLGFKVDGKKFRVYEPTLKDQKESNKVRNTAFYDALKSKAPLRAEINTILRKKGEWDDERQLEYMTLGKKILEGEKRLKEGDFHIKEAKKLAIDIKKLRADMQEMLIERSRLDNVTAEGQADNMAFNYLVSVCLMVYNKAEEEEKYFKNLDDFLTSTSGDVVYLASEKLSTLTHGIGDDVTRALPENQFLLDFGFVNDKLELINPEGHLIDLDNKLIDEKGRYVDEDGNFVDLNGDLLTEDGEYKVEFKGFFDDEGNIVEKKIKVDEEVVEEEIVKEPEELVTTED